MTPTTPAHRDPLREFRPERVPEDTSSGSAPPGELKTAAAVPDARSIAVSQPALVVDRPPRSWRVWRRPSLRVAARRSVVWGVLAPFAYGSLFGAAVVWTIIVWVIAPTSRPLPTVPRPAPSQALGDIVSASGPVTLDEATSPGLAEASPALGEPTVADTPAARRDDVAQPPASVTGKPPVLVTPEAPAAVTVELPVSPTPEPRRAVVEPPVSRTLEPPSRANRVTPPSAPDRPVAYVGSVSIDSAPAGARVLINSRPAGVTPLRLNDLPVGSRAIRVEADGYVPWSSVVRIVADQLTVVETTLSPASPGDTLR